MRTESERNALANATAALVGKKVVRVRYMSSAESAGLMWGHRALVLEFDDGTIAFAACDEEANDAGVVFVQREEYDLCLGRFPA